MEYRNKKTGCKFDSNFKISGGDWELVTDQKEQMQQDTTPVASVQNISEPVTEPEPTVAYEPDPNEPTGNADIDSLSKKDIIQELEAMGIEHNPRDKKQVLYDLMMGK